MAERQFDKGLEEYELHGVFNTKKELLIDSNAVVLELKLQGLKCAGKKIKPGFYNEASPREKDYIQKRLECECKVLSNLRHPNILQFMGITYGDHVLPIIVSEFLTVTLNAHLKKNGVFPDPISYSILDDVAKGLCYLHSCRPYPIIHENLTANTILLTENKIAKISYLGEAKIQCLKLPLSSNLDPLMYRARESDDSADTLRQDAERYRIDIFSFGVLIIHTFCGNCPMQPNISHQDEIAFMLKQIDADHPLMNLSKQCLTTDKERICLQAADIQDGISKVRVQKKIDSSSVVQESAYAAEWQQLMSTIYELQSDRHAMIEEQRHTAGALKPHSTFITEIENLELSELKTKNSHMKENIERMSDELESKRTTIEAKNHFIKELIGCKENEEDAVFSLHNKEKELLLKEELLRISEKRVEQLTHLITNTRSNMVRIPAVPWHSWVTCSV